MGHKLAYKQENKKRHRYVAFWLPIRSVYIRDGFTNKKSIEWGRWKTRFLPEEAELIAAKDIFQYYGRPQAVVLTVSSNIPLQGYLQSAEGTFLHTTYADYHVITSGQVAAVGPALLRLFVKHYGDFGYLHCDTFQIYEKGETGPVCANCTHKFWRLARDSSEPCSAHGDPPYKIYNPLWGKNVLDEKALDRDNLVLASIAEKCGLTLEDHSALYTKDPRTQKQR